MDLHIRCLAFTCSKDRPFYLRSCILGMERQTYPIDHSVYVNGLFHASCLDDLLPKNRLFLRYGPVLNQHHNHLMALFECGEYDLYFKIDDDDIYMDSYVKSVIESYLDTGWDYSAQPSHGLLRGKYYDGALLESLCLDPTPEEIEGNVLLYMPSSLVMNRKALDIILNLSDEDLYHPFEDIVWRNALHASKLNYYCRPNSKNYIYHVHGSNISTKHWL